jgi:hypothetical protein
MMRRRRPRDQVLSFRRSRQRLSEQALVDVAEVGRNVIGKSLSRRGETPRGSFSSWNAQSGQRLHRV